LINVVATSAIIPNETLKVNDLTANEMIFFNKIQTRMKSLTTNPDSNLSQILLDYMQELFDDIEDTTKQMIQQHVERLAFAILNHDLEAIKTAIHHANIDSYTTKIYKLQTRYPHLHANRSLECETTMLKSNHYECINYCSDENMEENLYLKSKCCEIYYNELYRDFKKRIQNYMIKLILKIQTSNLLLATSSGNYTNIDCADMMQLSGYHECIQYCPMKIVPTNITTEMYTCHQIYYLEIHNTLYQHYQVQNKKELMTIKTEL
jgi:hypothetical protein